MFSFLRPPLLRLGAAAMVASAPLASCLLAGCGISDRTAVLAPGPEPVRLTLRPAVIPEGSGGLVTVASPTADSIAIASANGVDRYWGRGPRLTVRLGPDFGDSVAVTRYAVRDRGRLFDLQRKTMLVSACRRGRCRTFHHDIAVRLPERNDRSFAFTTGWSTAFTKRALVGANRSVLFQEALNNAVWTAQAEFAIPSLSARAQGFYRADSYGGSLDLSRLIAGNPEGLNYGIALHVGVSHDGWLPPQDGAIPAAHTAYSATLGPSIMLKGLTASSQFGLYTDGRETLQVLSTRISINGGLTDVRLPVSATAEKTFSFGRGAIVPRRQDAIERFTVGVQMVRDLGIKLGVSAHTSRWPSRAPEADLRAKELYLELGAEYSWGW